MDNIEVLYDSFSSTVSTKSHHIKFQGEATLLGLALPALPARQVFITINISPKQPMVLNKGTRLKWGNYTVTEQFKIISRYKYYLDTISDLYEIHFEFTRNGDLHLHAIVTTTSYDKDIRIGSGRFFSIPSEHYKVFCDIRLCEDYSALVEYLTGKTTKSYQTSNIPPIIKKPIDEFN